MACIHTYRHANTCMYLCMHTETYTWNMCIYNIYICVCVKEQILLPNVKNICDCYLCRGVEYCHGYSCKGVDIGVWLFLCPSAMGWQLRFSLCSGAVTAKDLTMVVVLYCPLVPGSVEYPMPYASCLECGGVLICCASLSCSSCYSACPLLYCNLACPPVFSLKELCLSEVLGFCSLFYLVHSHDAR